MSGNLKHILSIEEVPVDLRKILPFEATFSFELLRNIFIEVIEKTTDNNSKGYFCSLPELFDKSKLAFTLDVLPEKKSVLERLLPKTQSIHFQYTGSNPFYKAHLQSELTKIFPQMRQTHRTLMHFYKTWDDFVYDVYKASICLEFLFLHKISLESKLFAIQNSSRFSNENYYKSIIDLFEQESVVSHDEDQILVLEKIKVLLKKRKVSEIMTTPQWSTYMAGKEFSHPYHLCTFVYGANIDKIIDLFERRKAAEIFSTFFTKEVIPMMIQNVEETFRQNPMLFASGSEPKTEIDRMWAEFNHLKNDYITPHIGQPINGEKLSQFTLRLEKVNEMYRQGLLDFQMAEMIDFYERKKAQVRELAEYNILPIEEVVEEEEGEEELSSKELFPAYFEVNDASPFILALQSPVIFDEIKFLSLDQYGLYKTCLLFLPNQRQEIKQIFVNYTREPSYLLYSQRYNSFQTNVLTKVVDEATKFYFLSEPSVRKFFLHHSKYRFLEFSPLPTCREVNKNLPSFIKTFQTNINQGLHEYTQGLTFQDEKIMSYVVDKTKELERACRIWSEFSEKVLGKQLVWTSSLKYAFWNAIYKFKSFYDINLTRIPGFDELQKNVKDEFSLQYVCKNLLFAGTEFASVEQLSYIISNTYFQVVQATSPENSFVLQQSRLQFALSTCVTSVSEIEQLNLSDYVFNPNEQNLLHVFSVLLQIFLGIDFPGSFENFDALWEFIETHIATSPTLVSKLFFMADRFQT